MDIRLARTVLPMVYGIVVGTAYLVLSGSVATVIAIVGAMLLGLFYILGRSSAATDPRGRNRNRNRNRG